MACVAYMDSGNQDINPSALKNAMAMPSGDSLYIAMRVREPFKSFCPQSKFDKILCSSPATRSRNQRNTSSNGCSETSAGPE